jgi:6-phosphofructokinase 1
MTFLEQGHEAISRQKGRQAPRETAAVITIQGNTLKWVPVDEMVQHADMANRRGKTNWWAGIKDLVEQLAGKPQFLGT